MSESRDSSTFALLLVGFFAVVLLAGIDFGRSFRRPTLTTNVKVIIMLFGSIIISAMIPTLYVDFLGPSKSSHYSLSEIGILAIPFLASGLAAFVFFTLVFRYWPFRLLKWFPIDESLRVSIVMNLAVLYMLAMVTSDSSVSGKSLLTLAIGLVSLITFLTTICNPLGLKLPLIELMGVPNPTIFCLSLLAGHLIAGALQIFAFSAEQSLESVAFGIFLSIMTVYLNNECCNMVSTIPIIEKRDSMRGRKSDGLTEPLVSSGRGWDSSSLRNSLRTKCLSSFNPNVNSAGGIQALGTFSVAWAVGGVFLALWTSSEETRENICRDFCRLDIPSGEWRFDENVVFPSRSSSTNSMPIYFSIATLVRALLHQLSLTEFRISNFATESAEVEMTRVSHSSKGSRVSVCLSKAVTIAKFAGTFKGRQMLAGANFIFNLVFFSVIVFAFGEYSDTGYLPQIIIAASAIGAVTNVHTILARSRRIPKVFPTDDSMRLTTILKALMLTVKTQMVVISGETESRSVFSALIIIILILSLAVVSALTAINVLRLWRVRRELKVANPTLLLLSYLPLFFWVQIASLFVIIVSQNNIHSATKADKSSFFAEYFSFVSTPPIFVSMYITNEVVRHLESIPTDTGRARGDVTGTERWTLARERAVREDLFGCSDSVVSVAAFNPVVALVFVAATVTLGITASTEDPLVSWAISIFSIPIFNVFLLQWSVTNLGLAKPVEVVHVVEIDVDGETPLED